MSEEQEAIVQCQASALRVVAFAGTGKTTTLRAYAQARPGVRMLYLAFNRSVAQEAQGTFGEHVRCLTIHGLAYRAVGHHYRHKLRGSLRAHQAAEALGLGGDREQLVLADGALQALQHFLCSGCWDLSGFAQQVGERYPRQVLQAAEQLWRLMQDPSDRRVPMLHDGYLKLYQLSRPQLRFDVILLDEAQDTNPVTLAILEQQQCAKVLVGDPHQQIYQFRHATNAMAGGGEWQELALTGSFRFGEEIAAAANRLLAVKGESRRVRGLREQPAAGSHAFIARGNAALFLQAVGLLNRGQPLHWCGGIEGYRHELLLDLWHLHRGDREQVRDPFVAAFKSYAALSSYAEEQNVRDLRAWCQLLERSFVRMWAQQIPDLVAGLRRSAIDQPGDGVLSLATVHKSKGLEFNEVELAQDFPEHQLVGDPLQVVDGVPCDPEKTQVLWDAQGFRGVVVLREEELNLRYVAVTRAKATCHSAQWSAPLFAGLERFVNTNPRFLLLPTLAGFKGKDQAGEGDGSLAEEGADGCAGNKGEQGSEGRKRRKGRKEEQVERETKQGVVQHPVLTLEPLVTPKMTVVQEMPQRSQQVEEQSHEPTRLATQQLEQTDQPAPPKTLQRLMRAVRHLSLVPERRKAPAVMEECALPCPTCPTPADEARVLAALGAPVGSDSDEPVLQAVKGVASPVSGGLVWQLGALEQSRVRVVVQHYQYRYPALDWEWLLNALSELRLAGESQEAVSRFLGQHQLESAQAFLERFLLDVGLWVVAK
ncbi:ATP-dependent helicase [Synechococcus sp. ATX 2A4]|uniref:UvrD-helicase domain-containing protein n=1 Tax=Synechococcus sp. ATX 2A4 TaxID=2823727 RepID=UPI0020CCA680|nr:UvrD-helicase domain-containing protein [Synechococcus sp. ATX 2A4]MCP9885857.1 ATP-dependent helicase [Synechococcus sp. ATX 2A4]